MPAQYWGLTPEVNAIRLTTGPGAAAMAPVGKAGVPEDIAWGVVYLASDEARYVTGSELVIDGGATAG